MSISVSDIAQLVQGQLSEESNEFISVIAPIVSATSNSLTFLSNPKYEQYIYETHASAVLVNTSFQPKSSINATLIRVEDPYMAFCEVQNFFHRQNNLSKTGRENPHFLGENVLIGKEEYIGAFAYIGDQVKIGNQVKIHPQVFIGDGCEIGDFTIIQAGAKIFGGTKIGNHCTIKAGAVIGSDGFGFAPKKDGSYQKIPQAGNVILGNHVDIGANTTIDCATLGSTIISDGVKIDNLVQIAHNVSIDQNAVIAAQTGISGSTSVGKNVMIGGQVGTVGHIHIADHTKVGARSGVTKSTQSDQILFGVPAIDRNTYLKSYAIYKKLPQAMKRIQELEQKLLTLASSIKPK
ncbi:MAG: UDP-3-O-(3-hydroxymyristoyl)glucosamine N-acyltransferase [Cyclobacteriaceae bacterium]